MALKDPVAVYNAANNLEAQLLRNLLAESGVEAFVTEDISQVGTWVGGLIPELHKPQVWVDRAEMERAKPLLEEYERRSALLRQADSEAAARGEQIDAVCEDCGGRVSFPVEQRGSVQQCPLCGEYVDVPGEPG